MTVMTCFAFSGWHEILSEHTKALLRSRWTQDYGQKILWQNGKHRLRKSAPLAVSHLDEKEMMLCCFRDDALVAKLCPTLVTPWVVAHQAPLSMGFSRQEYWSGLPFPSPGDLTDPGIEPKSPVSPALAGGFFTTVPPGKPHKFFCSTLNKLSWALPSCPEIQSQPVPLGMPLNIWKRSNKETWLLLTRIPQHWL